MEEEYLYSRGMLERIVEAYSDIYGGIPEMKHEAHKVPDDVLVFALANAIILTLEEPTSYYIQPRELAEILRRSSDITDLFSIAEHKADFDHAFNELGRGAWIGEPPTHFKDYKYFGRLQRLVISQMLYMDIDKLERYGFNNARSVLGTAYFRMAEILNE